MLELARHPEQVDKLRDELAAHMPDPNADIQPQEIANLDHLNAVIYETLRMYPPVPAALQRKTPPEGIEIGGQHIPGDMTVGCPQYAVGRSKESTHKHLAWNCFGIFSTDAFRRRGSLRARERIRA